MTINVFLADDHAVVRDGLSALLEAETDIDVIGTAPNGRETVRQVKNLHPDVVIMDIAMPKMNGIEATEQIAETCPSTLVIILSMYSSKEHISRALTAGARGYLLKDSAGKEVAEAIRVVHSGSRYLSRRIGDTVIDDYIEKHQAATSQSPLDRLSSRERQVMQLVVEGQSSSKIAEALDISPKTVDTYRSRLMRKLGIGNLPGLVKFAIRHELTTLDR